MDLMKPLCDKTIVITGASRGIGKAIGLRAARDGANVVVIGKTVQAHPTLPGTIHSAADEIKQAGGNALACQADIRFEDQVQNAVDLTMDRFGGIDILVNNASAIFLAGTVDTPMKRFDLMHQVDVRGTYRCTQRVIPHLVESTNPHILNICPPLNMDSRWFSSHVAYTMAKYGMSMCVLGMSDEFSQQGIAVNALWPRTAIATAAIENLLGGAQAVRCCRTPEIMADAAHAILVRDSRECSGNFFLDDEVLEGIGVTDLDRYAVDPTAELMIDLFL